LHDFVGIDIWCNFEVVPRQNVEDSSECWTIGTILVPLILDPIVHELRQIARDFRSLPLTQLPAKRRGLGPHPYKHGLTDQNLVQNQSKRVDANLLGIIAWLVPHLGLPNPPVIVVFGE
jgi:hypothetical protein